MVSRLAVLVLGMAPAAVAAGASAAKSLLRGSAPESVMVGGWVFFFVWGCLRCHFQRAGKKKINLALFFMLYACCIAVGTRHQTFMRR